jgi:transcriptional regulator GlxA family with amidase domain
MAIVGAARSRAIPPFAGQCAQPLFTRSKAGIQTRGADKPLALTSFHADVARPWSVASLAEEARVSRTAFSERFTRLGGMPPMTYLIKWRMAVAKDILQRERLSQDVVAATVGYQSASAFSMAFRRAVRATRRDLSKNAELLASDSTATAPSGARSHQIGRSRSGPQTVMALAISITRAGIW